MENGARPNVLVVDHHSDIARRIAQAIERAGFQTACAFSGKEGLAAFYAALSAGTPFSAVVTDFSMPDVDGLAMAAAVKASNPATPVVLVTAYSIDSDDALPPNIDALVNKSPSEALLRSTLARLVGQS